MNKKIVCNNKKFNRYKKINLQFVDNNVNYDNLVVLNDLVFLVRSRLEKKLMSLGVIFIKIYRNKPHFKYINTLYSIINLENIYNKKNNFIDIDSRNPENNKFSTRIVKINVTKRAKKKEFGVFNYINKNIENRINKYKVTINEIPMVII